jgi:hypothetical protein
MYLSDLLKNHFKYNKGWLSGIELERIDFGYKPSTVARELRRLSPVDKRGKPLKSAFLEKDYREPKGGGMRYVVYRRRKVAR